MLGRIIFIGLFLGVIISVNYLVYRTFRNFLLRSKLKTRTVNLVTRIPFTVFLLPYIILIFTRFDFTDLPLWVDRFVMIPFFAFQGAVIFTGLYLLACKIIKLPFLLFRSIINRVKSLKERYKKFRSHKSVIAFDKSRRNFLTASSAAVAGYAFIGAGIGAISKDDFRLEEQTIKLKNLPEEFKGLTAVLISDIHSGPFMEYGMMRHYVDVINDLSPDMVFIPGDVTNSNRNEAAPFAKAFRDLKAKHGIFGTMGNHDYFSSADYISDILRNETPINVLRNDFSRIKINGKSLIIAGTEDTRDSGNNSNHILSEYVRDTLKKSEDFLSAEGADPSGVPKLLLAHKPYMFDEISGMNFDMMFSGHTHGGQIVFLKFADVNVSIASTVNKYISGLYSLNGKYMYVSRGLGTVGLPLRLNCPPEITKFTLI